jgi:glycosyltransferase involved in cell wall biosynthesis
VLDLISFHIGTYSGETEVWLRYRDVIRQSVGEADGVVAISEDVRAQIERHQLPVDPSRLFVVPVGTDHVMADDKASVPEELLRRGFLAGEFLLCLGTNYSHKNRHLAIDVLQELRRRGRDLGLVFAGFGVPWGSTRDAETSAADIPGIFVLPEVPVEERNWLLRHAAVVLYPTSAEGFGLVPFEAARLGTPTVHVAFGPLVELARAEPVVADNWQPATLADCVEALLADPALAQRQLAAVLDVGARYTWSDAARKLTAVYRRVLSLPPRR